MAAPPPGTVTQLLEALQEGERSALDDLFPLVYEELRALAHRQRQGWRGDYTLNTTALVHEAYIKLVDQKKTDWDSRAHFFAVAAKAMRHILINYAERQRAQKRGGDVPKVSLDEVRELFGREIAMSEDQADALVALNEALLGLERVNVRQCQIVECRFFGGMTIDETAAALDLSAATVKRGWAVAQAWLYRALQEDSD